jgi:hypothetical protein
LSIANRPRRSLAILIAIGLLLVATGTAAAMPPQGDTAAAAQGRPGGGGGGGGGGGPKATRGFDISYPQCGSPYPQNPAFGIVGVNGGRVFSANPCLASQITWGGGAATELYINTGNPGPAISSFWPVGQTSPRFCDPANTDTADCAYDYGWNAAKQSWETAGQAYAELGLTANPAATTWWLDVETTNSWRQDVALNVAALQGEVDYLRTVAGVTKLGFYSTTVQWGEITGATSAFSAYPSWGAGAPSEKAAKQHCVSTPGFTGGRLAMVQYIWSGFDADVRC